MTTHIVTSADGTPIAFSVTGPADAPAIISVDGATMFRAMDFSDGAVGRQLGQAFRFVTYDRRGRGESGDTHPYAVEREIEDIAALIDHLGGRAALFGVSSGAVLALRAAKAGLPIDALACYEPPFVVSSDREPVAADYVERLDLAVADGRPGDAVRLLMTEAALTPAPVVDSMVEQPFWPALEGVGHTVAYDGRIMGDTMLGRPEALDVFHDVGTPTLVLSGGASDAWMTTAAEELAKRLPNATVEVLPDQTHQVDPAVLAAALFRYFTSIANAPAGA
ncbi:alpha/beta fold hydrolase [Actinoalloteichus spitiensis]|uniref:alpha/beta fold hydrolase n=1 Tax=Actinoalloteichus spitiensis TaxID=252394 RepID=UPI000375F82B|nr:alpha/beta hydrolase [Actinoalloteichus spitiensis]